VRGQPSHARSRRAKSKMCMATPASCQVEGISHTQQARVRVRERVEHLGASGSEQGQGQERHQGADRMGCGLRPGGDLPKDPPTGARGRNAR
jgi:hypothetical protein